MVTSRLLEILFKLALTAGSIWVLSTAVNLDPDTRGFGTHEQLDMEPCGYLQATGRPCITCGMTTSFSNTVRFRFVDAFRASPAGLLLCLFTIAIPAWTIHSLLTGAALLRFLKWRWGKYLPFVLVLVLLASWFYKIQTS